MSISSINKALEAVRAYLKKHQLDRIAFPMAHMDSKFQSLWRFTIVTDGIEVWYEQAGKILPTEKYPKFYRLRGVIFEEKFKEWVKFGSTVDSKAKPFNKLIVNNPYGLQSGSNQIKA